MTENGSRCPQRIGDFLLTVGVFLLTVELLSLHCPLMCFLDQEWPGKPNQRQASSWTFRWGIPEQKFNVNRACSPKEKHQNSQNGCNSWTFRLGPFFGLVCQGDSWLDTLSHCKQTSSTVSKKARIVDTKAQTVSKKHPTQLQAKKLSCKQEATTVVQTQILVVQGLLCGNSSEKVPYYSEKGPGGHGKSWPKYRCCFSCFQVRGGSLPSRKSCPRIVSDNFWQISSNFPTKPDTICTLHFMEQAAGRTLYDKCLQLPTRTPRAQRLKRKSNLAWCFQSRLKNPISLEVFDLDLQNSPQK